MKLPSPPAVGKGLLALGLLLLCCCGRSLAAPTTFTVALNAGWNAVGFQGTQVTSLSGPTVVGVSTYDGSYRTGALDVTTVNDGDGPLRGFWVYSNAAGNLTYAADQGTRPTSLVLRAGWNLVAFPTEISDLRAYRNGQLVSVLMYRLDTNGATTAVTTVTPGRAHWVFASEATQLVWGGLPVPSPLPSPAAEYWESYLTIPPSAGNWTVDEGIRSPGGNVAPTVMILPDGRLRLFYPIQGGLGSAISSDGLSFTIEPGPRAPVIGDVGVIYLKGGGYRIVFPNGPNGSQTLGSAISTDGFNFTVEPGERYRPTSQDAGLVQVPHVLRLPDGRWRLYYIGDFQGTGGSKNRNSIRTAISSDEGRTFTSERQGDVFPSNWVDPDMVYLVGGGYRLYTKTTSGGPNGASSFSHADSSDGLTVTGALTLDIDGNNRFDPFVIKLPNGTVRMYYGIPQGIVSATAH